MKQLKQFDKYKTPEEWKERAAIHGKAGRAYVKRNAFPAILLAALLLCGGIFGFSALKRLETADDTDSLTDKAKLDAYVVESYDGHFYIFTSEKELMSVSIDANTKVLDENGMTSETAPDIGDEVTVYFDGTILATYPGRIDKCSGVKIKNEYKSGRLIDRFGSTQTGTVLSVDGSMCRVDCSGTIYDVTLSEFGYVYNSQGTACDKIMPEVGDVISFVEDSMYTQDDLMKDVIPTTITTLFMQRDEDVDSCDSWKISKMTADGNVSDIYVADVDCEFFADTIKEWSALAKNSNLKAPTDDELSQKAKYLVTGSELSTQTGLVKCTFTMTDDKLLYICDDGALELSTSVDDENYLQIAKLMRILNGTNGNFAAQELSEKGSWFYRSANGDIEFNYEYVNDKSKGEVALSVTAVNISDKDIQLVGIPTIDLIAEGETVLDGSESRKDPVVKAGEEYELCFFSGSYTHNQETTLSITNVLGENSWLADELPEIIDIEVDTSSDEIITQKLKETGSYQYTTDDGKVRFTIKLDVTPPSESNDGTTASLTFGTADLTVTAENLSDEDIGAFTEKWSAYISDPTRSYVPIDEEKGAAKRITLNAGEKAVLCEEQLSFNGEYMYIVLQNDRSDGSLMQSYPYAFPESMTIPLD